jgi:hypothetical protein
VQMTLEMEPWTWFASEPRVFTMEDASLQDNIRLRYVYIYMAYIYSIYKYSIYIYHIYIEKYIYTYSICIYIFPMA